MPRLWVVAGPNGAGKTTLVSRRLAGHLPVVNPDEIALELPPVRGRPDERQAGEIAIMRRQALLEARAGFAIETTLTGASALRLMRKASDIGYRITLIYVGIPDADLSAMRVMARVLSGGHAVPLSAVRRRHPASLANLPAALALADRAYVFDNGGLKRRLLLVQEYGHTRWIGDDLPDWFRRTLPSIA